MRGSSICLLSVFNPIYKIFPIVLLVDLNSFLVFFFSWKTESLSVRQINTLKCGLLMDQMIRKNQVSLKTTAEFTCFI